MFFACQKFPRVLCILLFFTGIFTYAGGENRAERIIRKLDNPKYTKRAIRYLIKLQKKAVPYLLREAVDGKNIARRGWAIFCLSQIDGNAMHLQKIYQDVRQAPLVRTWALAACIHKMDSLTELTNINKYVLRQLPAVKPLLSTRIITLLTDNKNQIPVEMLLDIAQRSTELQSTLNNMIMQKKLPELARVMLTAKKQEVRRLAAGYLASMGRKNNDQVALQILDKLHFNAQATEVPWANGPLFLPLLRWERTTAKPLLKNLVSWFLWCKRQGKEDEQQQISNNISGGRLTQAIGYTHWSIKNPLVMWGKVVGRKQLQRLFEEQGVHKEKYYIDIVNKAPEKPMKAYNSWDDEDW